MLRSDELVKKDIVDQDIARNIVTKIEGKVEVDADDVDVRVEDGNVDLNGSVPTWMARDEAFRSALFTPGVVQVSNHIAVTGVNPL